MLVQRVDPLARAAGFITWAAHPGGYRAAAVPANQEVQVNAVYLPYGEPINHVCVLISTAGAGTAPTGFFVGIGNATGMLAQSGNLNSSAELTATGLRKLPLSATFVPDPADSETGLFYVVILKNGTFSVTDIQLARTGGIIVPGTGVTILGGRAGTGQTALPANGNNYSSAIAAAGGQDWFVGAA